MMELKKKLDSLIQQHPDCVKPTSKFSKEFHHQVNYKSFENNKPILKDHLNIPTGINEYGLYKTIL